MPKTLKRISPGIYRDAYGLRAVVDVASGRKEKRFAGGTPLPEIKRWREEAKVKLDAKARRRPSQAGTLRVDARRYLAQIKGLASWKSRRSEIEAWIAAYGDRRRGTLTEGDVRAAVAKWRSEGRAVGTGDDVTRKPYSVRTCEHRVATLRHLFHVLDGDVETPCDRITFDLPPTRPVRVAPTVLVSVLVQLLEQPDQTTAARHAVLSSTGARPAELMRAIPEDVDLGERLWIVRTAKGGERRVILLNDDMVAAWTFFARVNAWGPYDTSTHAKRLYEAGWPRGVRPYNTRASFGIELSRRGTDLADIQQLLGHRQQTTTRQYYVPPEDSRLAAATRSIGGRLGLEKILAVDLGRAKKTKKMRRAVGS